MTNTIDLYALADELEDFGATYATVAGRTGWYRGEQYLGRTVRAAMATIQSLSTEDAS